ncbi:MAG: hypothetical protein ACK53Y_02780, partial [bacterium]
TSRIRNTESYIFLCSLRERMLKRSARPAAPPLPQPAETSSLPAAPPPTPSPASPSSGWSPPLPDSRCSSSSAAIFCEERQIDIISTGMLNMFPLSRVHF